MRNCSIMFRSVSRRTKRCGGVCGFPQLTRPWCNGHLKVPALRVPFHNRKLVQETQRWVVFSATRSCEGNGVPAISNGWFSQRSLAQGAKKNIVQYLGIAADEPERIARHQKPGFKMPLVEIGWDEVFCRQICEENGLLSPIYTSSARGGCWFCHNQGVDQLRQLRRNYPDLWELLLKWDKDSPVSFKADGRTVHDYDRRFQLEDQKLIFPDDRVFRWAMLDDSLNFRLF